MSKVIAGITVSLDGFINDSNGSVEKLYSDFIELKENPYFQEMIKSTGAVIMGRNVYEMADPFSWVTDDYEFQTPIFVLTHTPPDKYPTGNDKLSLHFVTDGIESAIKEAQQVADGKDIQIIGGANTIHQALESGLTDELHIDIVSVVLGGGLKLFDKIDNNQIKFERIKVETVTPLRTSFVFKVIK